jgi:hypothetical protein
MIEFLWKSLLIGAGGTLAMDVWALVLNRAAGIPLPNWALVGRWFCHIPRGRLFHDDIAAARGFESERAVGWISHYAIGIVYAGVLIAVMGPDWLAAPTFLPAWILGMVTIGAGWFLLQPGMGAGIASSRRANASQIRLLNVLAHTVFATGLWATALAAA